MDDYLAITYWDELLVHQHTQWKINSIQRQELTGNRTAILKYGEFPFETLEVSDDSFLPAMAAKYRHFAAHGKKNFAGNLSTPSIIVITACFLGLAVCTWLFVLPFIADRLAMNMSYETEAILGNQLDEKFRSEFEVDENETQLVNRFFRESGITTKTPVSIVVLNSSEMNAFAIPGGHIYIYDKLLHSLDRPEQLAGLIAHEYSHVELKHATRSILRNLSGYIFISIILGDISGMTALIIQHAETLKSLQYSRKLEEEADLHGFQLMADAGINPEGMIGLLEKLKAQGNDAPAAFISTHPLLVSRIEYIRKKIEEENLQPVHNQKMEDAWTAISESR